MGEFECAHCGKEAGLGNTNCTLNKQMGTALDQLSLTRYICSDCYKELKEFLCIK